MMCSDVAFCVFSRVRAMATYLVPTTYLPLAYYLYTYLLSINLGSILLGKQSYDDIADVCS